MILSFQEIFNIIVISVSITLTVYHVFVFIGRRNKSELYYLYFAAFGLFFSVYMLFTCKLRNYIFPSDNERMLLSPIITYFSYVLMQWFAFEVFKILLEFNIKNKKFLYPYYLPFVGQFFSMISSYFTGYDYYIKNVYWLTTVFAAIGPIYMIILFINHILRNKLYKVRSIQIVFSGWLILACDFFLEELLPSLGIDYPFRETYFGSGLSLLVYAFALSDRFNREYSELTSLRYDLEEKVVSRTREITLLNEQKSALFINIAHEIRTPATLLQNYINKLFKKYTGDKDILIVKSNIDKLVKDMVNFLDTEKIEQGRLCYDDRHRIDITGYLNEKADLIVPTLSLKRLNLIKNIASGLEITSNIHAIDRIFNNLLDNAIRYTPENGSITIEANSSANSEIKFNIIDTGSGIPDVMQEHIFDKYYQISHQKGNYQGIGMGLFITKSIVENLGGKILFKSEHTGTTFTVTLPVSSGGQYYSYKEILKKESRADITPEIIYNSHGTFCTDLKTILLVEDNYELLNSIKEFLLSDYNVLCAINGENAFELLKQNEVNLIVSDIMMDVMDGYEFLNRIRAESRYTHIPFIFLTAKSGLSEEIRGLSAGAIDFIQKPFSLDILKSRIQSILLYNELLLKTYDLQKYKAIGTLTASICHEILNPLSGIKGPLEIIKKISQDCGLKNDSYDQGIHFINENANRIADIVGTMRSLFHGDLFLSEIIDLQAFLLPLLKIFSDKYKHCIQLSLSIDEPLLVYSNKKGLTQIIINLLNNAAEAISTKGSIIIKAAKNDNIILTIEDTGCGIAKTHLDKIFDLEFSTKKKSGGTGLGLFIVKEMADRLSIKLSVKSEIGKGTEISLTFPPAHSQMKLIQRSI
ncbi:MAG: response regulator [Fibrobacter sp.]|nr:response regulator [Fibrobacter sp.]